MKEGKQRKADSGDNWGSSVVETSAGLVSEQEPEQEIRPQIQL